MAKATSSKSIKSTVTAPAVVPTAPVFDTLAFKTPETHENTPEAREKRRLTREEWKNLPPEEKKARKEAARATRPAPVARLTRNTLKIAKRVERIATMFATGPIRESLHNAATLIKSATTEISELPTDWRPASQGAARAARIDIGSLCSIHEKYKAEYTDLMGGDELDGLRVVKIVKKNVLLQSESGTRITIPLNKLVLSAS